MHWESFDKFKFQQEQLMKDLLGFFVVWVFLPQTVPSELKETEKSW